MVIFWEFEKIQPPPPMISGKIVGEDVGEDGFYIVGEILEK